MNGAHALPSLLWRPSTRITARTGPDCSTVTLSSTLSKVLRPTGAVSISGASWVWSTRRTFFSTSRPPRVAEAIRAEPSRGKRQVAGPVETSIAAGVSVTRTLAAPAAGLAGSIVRRWPRSPAGAAWPVHFSEPSGQ
jgi:hypothetical protein